MTNLMKPESFESVVRDKVRTVIAASIPDGHIDDLIKKEYDSFFSERVEYTKVLPSKFQELVAKIVEEEIRGKLKVWVNANLCDGAWNDNGGYLESSKKLVEDLAPVALKSVMAQITNSLLHNFRNEMHNSRY